MSDSLEKADKKNRVPYHFGEKLRRVREQKNLTLKVVAREAGVSESLVSQIERNLVSPAIDTLLALADVLDVNLEFLFEEYRRVHPVTVLSAGERPTREEGMVIYEELCRPNALDPNSNLESYVVRIPAGANTSHGSYGHPGREFGMVIQGECTLKYENREYHLKAGDSVSFPAASPHTLENTGNEEMKAFWVVTPAQRFID
ncbi:MAG: XRE family transcriptional regulator [Treponema sp.]|nr:XRE family transcriptional regulator [Treponema sp.]